MGEEGKGKEKKNLPKKNLDEKGNIWVKEERKETKKITKKKKWVKKEKIGRRRGVGMIMNMKKLRAKKKT